MAFAKGICLANWALSGEEGACARGRVLASLALASCIALLEKRSVW